MAYHGALQFHGKAHSLTRRLPFLTASKPKPFVFRGTEFVPVPVPPPLHGHGHPWLKWEAFIVRKHRGRDGAAGLDESD